MQFELLSGSKRWVTSSERHLSFVSIIASLLKSIDGEQAPTSSAYMCLSAS